MSSSLSVPVGRICLEVSKWSMAAMNPLEGRKSFTVEQSLSGYDIGVAAGVAGFGVAALCESSNIWRGVMTESKLFERVFDDGVKGVCGPGVEALSASHDAEGSDGSFW